MPKIVYTKTKGLHQTSGSGVSGLMREVIKQTSADGWNDAAYSLTVEQSGALILLDKNEATAITLPAITSDDIGVTFTFLETVASNLARSITTAYDNDYIVGGLSIGFDAADSGATDHVGAVVASAKKTVSFDGDLANAGGGAGSTVTLTAISIGNTAAGGGAKSVWALTGHMVNVANNGTGSAFLA